MSKKEKQEEASTVSGITGFQGPLGGKKKKKNHNSPYGDAELFENAIAYNLLDEEDVAEVVRKVGSQWILYDDETEVQIGAYPSRQAAWDKQRMKRKAAQAQRKAKTSERERQMRALEPTLAPKAKQAKAPSQQKAKKARSEAIVREIFKKVLQERSMVSYVFENTPVSDQSALWDNFLSKLSKQTILSDPKFKAIVQKAVQSEVKLLDKAVDLVKQALGETGSFDVEKKKVEKDRESGDIIANFLVKLKENNKVLGFAVKLENGKPLIVIPEDARMAINQMGNDESKRLRAELMHIQETVLEGLDDVVSVNSKRDKYLTTVEDKLDKFLNSLNFLEVAVLKYLLKSKYKGIK